MKYEEILHSEKEFLTPTDVAEVLGCHPYTITLAAREKPGLLGFPVTVAGRRTRIPRRAFIKFCEGSLQEA